LSAVRGDNSSSPPAARHGSYRSGFAFGILSFLAMAMFGLVSTIVTARIYGVETIGEFALVSAPITALWVLSTAKEQAALIKEITGLPPRHPRITQLFAAVFTFSSGLTALMSALAAVAVWFLFRGPLHVPELVTPTFVSLVGYTIVTNTAWNFDSIFSAFVAGRQLFWVRLHETLSFLAIATAIGLATHSLWGLVIATIGGSFTALIHRLVIVRHFVRVHLTLSEYRLGLHALPGLLSFGLKITPGSIAQGVSQQAGIWIIRATGGSVALVGAYSRALMIPERLQQVNMRIAEVLYPTLVGRRTRGEHHDFDRALTDTIRYALIGMLLIAAIFGGAAHSVLELFGPGFSRATYALMLLIAYPALNSITVAQNQALLAVDRPGLTSIVSVTRMTLTVAATVLLTPAIGITGPAIALLAGSTLDIVWKSATLHSYLSRRLHEIWPRKQRLAQVAGYVGGFGAAYTLTEAIPSVGGLLLGLAVATLVYICLLFGLGGINERDRARLKELTATIRARRDGRRVSPEAVG
jgi:O-antigen/teichoic acid export membrane protein